MDPGPDVSNFFEPLVCCGVEGTNVKQSLNLVNYPKNLIFRNQQLTLLISIHKGYGTDSRIPVIRR